MLESIREGVKKPWVKVIVFLIVISFIFAGYFTSSFFLGDPNAVAIVNDESISRVDFQQEYQRERSRRADYYNANVKTEEDEKAFQESVLQTLIDRKVTEQSTSNLGLRLSTVALRSVIQNDPNFKDADGNYSPAIVDQTLARIGMSREQLKSAFQYQEAYRHLVDGVTGTEFHLQSEVKSEYELISQKRSGKALKIDFEKFKQNLEITDADLETYYNENQEAFRIEEKVSVEYIELSIDKLQASQEPTSEDIEAYYQDNLPRYQGEDQKQYSHILVLNNDGEEAAEAKANAISQKLANGEEFKVVAEADSDEWGDLGILIEGALEPAAEEAAKQLVEEGQTSQPVKIEDGYQILKLTNLVAGETQTLEQVKDQITVDLKKQLAEEAYHSKAEILKEKSFEISDSLKESAEAAGVAIETSPMFGLSSRDGLFANQQVKDAAFSSDVKDALLNSTPIELGENHMVVLRLKEHQPSTIQPLEEVKERVKNSVTQSKAKKAAGEIADQVFAKLEAKEDTEQLIQEQKLQWTDLDNVERNNAALSYMTSQKFFKMPSPAEGEVEYEMVEDFQGFAILMLNKVEKGDWASAEDAAKKQRELFVSRYFANAGYSGFIQESRVK
ncbi:MAG: SurA N-terminal domain-containing protein, partial [Kangiellaceae bacterium]|nr:SurA N-terminal domain-containing protein [Kangiellaceae bacterium]